MSINRSTETQKLIEILRELVCGYTRHHDKLKVDGADMGTTIIMAIRGDIDDHPKLVGTKGKHVWALETIVQAIGRKMGRTVRLTLMDPLPGEQGPPAVFKPNPNWVEGAIVFLLRLVLDAALPTPYSLEVMHVLDLTTIQVRPAVWGDLCERGDFAKAVHAIFHAVGKTQGRDVHIDVCKAEQPAAA